MTRSFDVLIVGGGHAGAQAALVLRQQQFAGTIAIVGAEPELPYNRPPLSKEYLSGDKPWERLILRPAGAWADDKIDLLLDVRVISVDPNRRHVVSSCGDQIGYRTMIWATGGDPRQLGCGGHLLRGVHTVRNRADVDQIIAELGSVREVVVIGGGYIGLEAAAVLRKLDKHVTVIEALDRVLARVAGEPLSRFYEAEHRARGVDVRLNVAVKCIAGDAGQATGVSLEDGTTLPAQMVIIGIGILPAVKPLLDAGAEGGNGVRVDRLCRTSLKGIYAVGDCAEHRNPHAGNEWVRLESVQNAHDQAAVAAKAITGVEDAYASVPWFWSNQYDLKLQTVGISRGYDEIVVRGEPATRSFSLVYLKRGIVIALDCVNAVRDYSHGRLLVAAAVHADRAALSDTTTPLKTLVQ